MAIHRRRLGRQGLGSVGGLALMQLTDHAAAAEDTSAVSAPASESATERPNRIAISTYSFWRFLEDSKLSIERCIDEAARLGFDGVEILEMQMENEEPGHLQQL